MKPAGFVAKHETPIDQRRRSPDRCLCLILPFDFALVRRQTIEITVARADVNSSIRDNRTRPHSTLLLEHAAECLILPKQLAITLPEAINNAILGGRVDFAFVNRGR